MSWNNLALLLPKKDTYAKKDIVASNENDGTEERQRYLFAYSSVNYTWTTLSRSGKPQQWGQCFSQ